jgi:hypothetical protein
MSISITFLTLAMMAEAATAAKPAPPSDPQDKLICRRLEVVGSLVAGKRICMTKREWARYTEQSRAAAEDMQTSGNRLAGGNN